MLVNLNPWVRACATGFPALFFDLGFPPFFRVFSDMTLPIKKKKKRKEKKMKTKYERMKK
jgi:hypothetical protein